ncbi:MAG TPA: ferritin-like domain-containing protein [Bryobacteraceae bacterium]|nr:ferritin-like domain-containing protein [Bryobacteraceae bacterium]
MQSLFDLYVTELHDLYDAEHQILKALPKMIESATSDDLKKALQEHLDLTQIHSNRLEEVFEMHSEKVKGETCEGISGIVKEGRDLLKQDVPAMVRDAALISAAQRVEHYEIAVYGCVRTYADQLGFDRAARILQQTLQEEEEMDRKLTAIAQAKINVEAAKTAGR